MERLIDDLIRFEQLNRDQEVVQLFTTRRGGVSSSVYESLNMGFGRGDSDQKVFQNYQIVADKVGLSLSNWVLSAQTHTTNILQVTEQDRGCGIERPRPYTDVDGLVTNVRGIGLVTFYADCIPIFFFDPVRQVVAAAHAGWKGTAHKIGAAMVEKMGSAYGCEPADILVGIGPGICEDCYQVSEDVKKQFDISYNDVIINRIIKPGQEAGKYMLDLKFANQLQLVESGIPLKNIEISEYCTKCRSDLFFSHRAMGDQRGSQIGLIGLQVGSTESGG